MDDQTPQTAIVEAEVQGQLLRIDFLGNVLGVRPKALQEAVVEIIVPYKRSDTVGSLAIPVMHPLHCLQSRIANLIVLKRPDATARRQAEAAPVVLREYVDHALRDGDHREATRTLQDLFHFLAKDPTGRKAHRAVDRDPLEVMETFVDDLRIDSRYREKILRPAIAKIRKQRTAFGRILVALAGASKHAS
ncbi:hypothetical protein [Sphingomonas sp. GB1N7]|uniref:hypothetical protein n=1 Tax=Parasphingomonas caseinilytica TaxID=3096158 RepID=UPI002FC9978A